MLSIRVNDFVSTPTETFTLRILCLKIKEDRSSTSNKGFIQRKFDPAEWSDVCLNSVITFIRYGWVSVTVLGSWSPSSNGTVVKNQFSINVCLRSGIGTLLQAGDRTRAWQSLVVEGTNFPHVHFHQVAQPRLNCKGSFICIGDLTAPYDCHGIFQWMHTLLNSGFFTELCGLFLLMKK